MSISFGLHQVCGNTFQSAVTRFSLSVCGNTQRLELIVCSFQGIKQKIKRSDGCVATLQI